MADIDTSNWTTGTRYFTQITDDNHAGWLYIITILSFIYVIMAFVIRFVVKYGAFEGSRANTVYNHLLNTFKACTGTMTGLCSHHPFSQSANT